MSGERRVFMNTEERVIAVLTSKSLQTMIADGGSGNWRADKQEIQSCRWIVAIRNRHKYWPEGDEEHGTAFLIGKSPASSRARTLIRQAGGSSRSMNTQSWTFQTSGAVIATQSLTRR